MTITRLNAIKKSDRPWHERVGGWRRAVAGKIKTSLMDDVAPGVYCKAGGEIPSLRAMRAFGERHRLAALLPYETFDDETGLYFNRDTVGFVLLGAAATFLDPERLRILNGLFSQAHRPNTMIQVTLYADPNVESILQRWQKSKEGASDPGACDIFKILAKNRVDYLRSGKWGSLFSDQAFLLRNFQLMVAYTMPAPKGVHPCDMAQEELESLLRMRDSVTGTLRSAGIFVQNLAPDGLINLLSAMINPTRDAQPEIDYNDAELINAQVVDDNTAFVVGSGASSLIHDEESYTVLAYHVRQFPRSWPGMRSGELIGALKNNILRLSCPFVLTLSVSVPDQIVARGVVQRRMARATQMCDSPLAKYATQWRERKVDWSLVAEQIDNGDKLLKANFQVLLFAPQGREQQCEQALKSTYGALGWILSKSRFTPIHAFLGALPMGLCQETARAMHHFGHFHTRTSWTCTNIAPWIGEWVGTQSPTMLLMGRRGQLLYFDPFDNRQGNFNVACCAAPGSGKSFFTQEWIFSCLGSGGRAFVIDAGHSYRNLCELLGGLYLDFGDRQKSAKICLNPFTNIMADDPEFMTDQMPLLKALIGQMASPEQPLTALQWAVLEMAIGQAWVTHKNGATITCVAQALRGRKKEDGTACQVSVELATMLFPYTREGMFGAYFEGASNVQLDNPFVVLDLDALNPTKDLQAVVLLLLMMRITQVMYLAGNKAQRKLCIIDEAWRLLRGGNTGAFIEEGYRVARKHGGSFMTITQAISDYYRSEISKACLMCSDFVVYLRQKMEELAIAEAKNYIDNSDGRLGLLRTLETIQGKYSELAIASPGGLAVARFTVDPVTEKIYSTSATEVEFIRKARQEGLDIFAAVQALIKRSGRR